MLVYRGTALGTMTMDIPGVRRDKEGKHGYCLYGV